MISPLTPLANSSSTAVAVDISRYRRGNTLMDCQHWPGLELLFGTHSQRSTKVTVIYRRTGNLRGLQPLLGIGRSRAQCAISALRSMTLSPLPNRLMSDVSGQGSHALPLRQHRNRAIGGHRLIRKIGAAAALNDLAQPLHQCLDGSWHPERQALQDLEDCFPRTPQRHIHACLGAEAQSAVARVPIIFMLPPERLGTLDALGDRKPCRQPECRISEIEQ